ncbi:MAG TPA: AMP-binding protein [Beijerinckiaceae bacterium]|nr:AMP-binding protein [Beijerinckiaceae bacterium]
MQDEPHLRPRDANFQPLTPLDFLERTVSIVPDQPAIAWRDRRWTYRGFAELVGRMAAVLRAAGVGRGDVVSVLAQNRPELLAAHYAVPMLGAVLCAVNTRLDSETVGYILDHSESRLFLVDPGCSANAREAALRSTVRALAIGDGGDASSRDSLDALLAAAAPEPLDTSAVTDEWQPICLNYTSGTTGRPKGVVYHHRGAYLNALGNVLELGFTRETVYLWTLPMFHCNGWCHSWAVTAAGGTHICIDRPDPGLIFDAVEQHGVTHFCCAPVVLYMLLNHPGRPPTLSRRIKVATGGAAPTSTLIEQLEALGIDLVHLYGLTESYGPATGCALRGDWDVPSAADKARALSRQGVRHPTASRVRVIGENGQDVPRDASTLGEVALRGNTLMAGYLKDEAATEAAFSDGAFRTGDLAVMHADGYIEIKDRAKDIIISGGENISSLEIETVLYRHPAVLLAAVVAAPDPKWGEVPCAFIEIKPGFALPRADDLTAFCRERLAGFKVPKRFVFRELPKTATGKIQKFALRSALTASG